MTLCASIFIQEHFYKLCLGFIVGSQNPAGYRVFLPLYALAFGNEVGRWYGFH